MKPCKSGRVTSSSTMATSNGGTVVSSNITATFNGGTAVSSSITTTSNGGTLISNDGMPISINGTVKIKHPIGGTMLWIYTAFVGGAALFLFAVAAYPA